MSTLPAGSVMSRTRRRSSGRVSAGYAPICSHCAERILQGTGLHREVYLRLDRPLQRLYRLQPAGDRQRRCPRLSDRRMHIRRQGLQYRRPPSPDPQTVPRDPVREDLRPERADANPTGQSDSEPLCLSQFFTPTITPTRTPTPTRTSTPTRTPQTRASPAPHRSTPRSMSTLSAATASPTTCLRSKWRASAGRVRTTSSARSG
jgi:hypothetical protein